MNFARAARLRFQANGIRLRIRPLLYVVNLFRTRTCVAAAKPLKPMLEARGVGEGGMGRGGGGAGVCIFANFIVNKEA